MVIISSSTVGHVRSTCYRKGGMRPYVIYLDSFPPAPHPPQDLSLLTHLSPADIEHLQSVGKDAQAAGSSSF